MKRAARRDAVATGRPPFGEAQVWLCSMGLAIGTSAHGIGTARMLEVNRLAGAAAGLAIGLNGLMTTFLLPFLLALFHF